MARPPDLDALGKLNFITNYFLAGCTPPVFLFCQFAKEPAMDLGLLFLLPDLTDIGQAVFDPKGGRKRKPGRHGRKRRRRIGLPDPSDLIGQRARGVLNPHNALKFGPVNFAFRLWNRYEAISFTAAVVEGLADTGFQGLLGVMSVDPDHCTEFLRLVKTDTDPEFAGGIGPPVTPIRVKDIEVNTGFTTSHYTCMSMLGDYTVHFTMTLAYHSSDGPGWVSIALGIVGGGGRVLSPVRDVQDGDVITLTVSRSYKAGQACEWGLGSLKGFFTCLSRQVVAFSNSGIPWPL